MNLIRAFNWRESWCAENSNLPQMFFEQDLITPERVYPALDAQAWREGVHRYFSWGLDSGRQSR